MLATASTVPVHVLVLSGARYLAAGKGRVIVCHVVPGAVPDDFTSVHRVRYQTEEGVDTIGLAVPDLIDWYPASALGEPVGSVSDIGPVMRLVDALFR
ncbi:hypothetical protein [Alloactinosynnema sp. L-07]|uniref:hypothetical protein n=1 Tax=Alloactinosynnema sp. L-07 TaxID=1653480 RepID=UPI00065F0552|nr:hypothetical protein [Alloactinosynnema sp. L-07]CRK59689.1 hypothetical protein [Alloactinosynnema sp. L-07]